MEPNNNRGRPQQAIRLWDVIIIIIFAYREEHRLKQESSQIGVTMRTYVIAKHCREVLEMAQRNFRPFVPIRTYQCVQNCFVLNFCDNCDDISQATENLMER